MRTAGFAEDPKSAYDGLALKFLIGIGRSSRGNQDLIWTQRSTSRGRAGSGLRSLGSIGIETGLRAGGRLSRILFREICLWTGRIVRIGLNSGRFLLRFLVGLGKRR